MNLSNIVPYADAEGLFDHVVSEGKQSLKCSVFPSARLRSQINKSLRLQLSDTYHAAFVGNDEAGQQIVER